MATNRDRAIQEPMKTTRKKSLTAILFVLIVLLAAIQLNAERGWRRGALSAVEHVEISTGDLAVPGGQPSPGEAPQLDQRRAALPMSLAHAPEAEDDPGTPAAEPEPATGTLRVLVQEEGTGRLATGVPVKLMDVTVFQSGAAWDCVRHVLTDHEGVAEFTLVSAGRVSAHVIAAVSDGQANGKEVFISEGATSTITMRVSPAKPVVGHVEDAAGRRVAGATIWNVSQGFDGFVVGESAADGSFELPYQRPWSRLSASHPGHAPGDPVLVRDSHMEAGTDPGGTAPAITLTLSARRGRVFGRVLAPNGQPAGGVRIQLSQFEGKRDPQVQSATSELDGTFDFPDARVGTSILDARVVQGALLQEQLVVTDGGSHELVLQLCTGGTLQGSVTTPGGTPWSGAMVCADQRVYSSLGQTDAVVAADGTFVLRGQGPGEVKYRVMDEEGNELAVQTLLLLDDEVTEWHPVCAPRAPLEGHVHVAAGPPLTGWNVDAQPMRGPDAHTSWRGNRTDENGRFEVTPEAGATYRLRVFAPGASGSNFALEIVDVSIEDMPLDLVVPADRVPTGTLMGRLVDHDGNPVVAGRITVVIGEEPSYFRRATSGDDGGFELRHIPEGEIRVLDGALNSTKVLATIPAVAPGSIRNVGDIVMPE
jgi:5-hydroxyisourate hydrolase-like protein (transthyretin family)